MTGNPFYRYHFQMSIHFVPFHLLTETTIQGEFYHQARLIGLKCILELHTPAGRLDVAVFSDDWSEVTAIVECKKGALYLSNQIRKYKTLGVPVFGLNKLDKCAHLAAQIKRNHSKGVPLRKIDRMQVIHRSGRRVIGEGWRDEFLAAGSIT